MRLKPRQALAGRYLLGESPRWEGQSSTLSWVDIKGKKLIMAKVNPLNRISISEVRDFHELISFALPLGGRRYLVGLGGTLAVSGPGGIEAQSGILIPGARRFNDAVVDPNGQLIVGTLSLDGDSQENFLIRIRSDQRTEVLSDSLLLSNGLAFSPKGESFYSIDSLERTVTRWAYDAKSGDISRSTVLYRFAAGEPDGLAVDSRGNLWIALWGEGCIVGLTSTGRQFERVRVPGSNFPSSVAFFGSKVQQLFLTTALDPSTSLVSTMTANAGRVLISGFTARRGCDPYPWQPIPLGKIAAI